MTKITYIPGEIANAAIDEHGNRKPVTRTQHIFDDAKGKSQAEVNADTYRKNEVYDKEETNNIISRTPETDVMVLDVPTGSTAADVLNEVPVADRPNKLFRLRNYTNTHYDEYGWTGETWALLASKDYGIDDKPIAESDNLVKSSGISEQINGLPLINLSKEIPAGETRTGNFVIDALTEKTPCSVTVKGVSGRIGFYDVNWRGVVYNFTDSVTFYATLPVGIKQGFVSVESAFGEDKRIRIEVCKNGIGATAKEDLDTLREAVKYNIGGVIAEPIPFKYNNYYIGNTGEIGSILDITPVFNIRWRSTIIDCTEGELFEIVGDGSDNTRLYYFLGENNQIIACADAQANIFDFNPLKISAPAGATKLIINDEKSDRTSSRGNRAIDVLSNRLYFGGKPSAIINSVINVNELNNHPEPYNTKGDARNAVPSLLRKNGQKLVYSYLSSSETIWIEEQYIGGDDKIGQWFWNNSLWDNRFKYSLNKPSFMLSCDESIFKEINMYFRYIDVKAVEKEYVINHIYQVILNYWKKGTVDGYDVIIVAFIVKDKNTGITIATPSVNFRTSQRVHNTIVRSGCLEIEINVSDDLYSIVDTTERYVNSLNIIKEVQTEIYTDDDIDYNEYFSKYAKLFDYEPQMKYSLTPMLQIGKLIPNGGTLRFIYNSELTQNENSLWYNIFEESPYQNYPALRAMRFTWCQLESGDTINDRAYHFDVIEQYLIDCVNKKQRFVIGVLCNCYMANNIYAGESADSQGHLRKYTIPTYLFNLIQNSDHPMYEDSNYTNWWYPNYDSDIMLNYFEEFVDSLNDWLEGNITGTNIKRRDIIFAVENRCVGYWGEGEGYKYPSTTLWDGYTDKLTEAFHDKYLCAAAQELHRMPRISVRNSDEVRKAEHGYHILTTGTDKGLPGLFKDSWDVYNFIDLASNYMIKEEGTNNVIPVIKYLKENIYGKCYISGEFGFTSNNTKYAFYQSLYHLFNLVGVSGLSVHNFTENVSGGQVSVSGLYKVGREVLSAAGYRFVLHTPNAVKTGDTYTISFWITNIGFSKCFADYYKCHLLLTDLNGTTIDDIPVDYDLTTILPCGTEPLVFDPGKGTKITKESVSIPSGYSGINVRLVVKDEKNIEYPLCFSNYGRSKEVSGGDGSYFLLHIGE